MEVDDFKFDFGLDMYMCKNGHNRPYPASINMKDPLNEVSGGMNLDSYVRLICSECGCLMRKSYDYGQVPSTEYTDEKIEEYERIIKEIFINSTHPYAIQIRLQRLEKFVKGE